MNMQVMEVYHVVEGAEVTEPSALHELGSQMAESMKKLWETMYLICLVHNVDFLELLDEQWSTCGEYFLNSVDLLLSDPLYNVRSS